MEDNDAALLMFLVMIALLGLSYYGLFIYEPEDTYRYAYDNLNEDQKVNICEEYANASHIRIEYPEKRYIFNGIEVSEEYLKEVCSK